MLLPDNRAEILRTVLERRYNKLFHGASNVNTPIRKNGLSAVQKFYPLICWVA
jgi:hypothetical protein